jgi:amidase
MPVAPATAPRGLSSTGDPVFCVPGSFAGLPAIAIPSGEGTDGLPLSVQILTGPFSEQKLLSIASWCEKRLAFRGSPPLSAG